jgi:hypothetical protein
MAAFADLLQLAAAAALGVFAGAMLMEGALLVPWWRSLPPGDFLAWYAANERRLVRFFGAVTVAAAVLALAAGVAAFAASDPGRAGSLAAVVLTLAAVAMFPLYFQRANERFAAGTLPPEQLAPALRQWGTWHWVRTTIVAAAACAALVAAGAQ